MSHARIEEVSDSDPEIDDPSAFLPDSDQSIIRSVDIPSTSTSSRAAPPSSTSSYSQPQTSIPPSFQPPRETNEQTREKIKSYCTLYPIYFDSSRTRAQGRRVSSSLAISNPLAYNLLAAVRHALGNHPLHLAFEPDKTHPKDWANPGRVRIQMFSVDGAHAPLHPTVKSKSYLYTLIGRYLKDHPTQAGDPLQLKIQNLPVPDKFTETEVPRPRGWKMGSVLPVHSAAVSGGGVKDDFFKEAMEEMRQAQAQGQLPLGMGGDGGGGGGMPDMSALQSMMGGMGGMGGLGGMLGGGGGGGEGSGGAKKKKDKKKG